MAHAPGDRDLTANVDLAAIRRAAEAGGLLTLASRPDLLPPVAGTCRAARDGDDCRAVERRVAARTLMMPGGLGGTDEGDGVREGVGAPRLRGTAPARLT